MTWLNLSRRDLIQRRASRLSTAAHPANRAYQRQPLDQDPTVRKRSAQPCLRPTTEHAGRDFAGRLAGEGELDGAGQGRKWNPNTNAHPTIAGNSPEMDWSGGATRRSGGESTAKTAHAVRPCSYRTNARTSISGALGTHRDDPEVGRLPEEGWRW